MSPYPSRRPAAAPAIARHNNPAAEAAFVAQWLQHLEAGRIPVGPTATLLEAQFGNRVGMSPEELATQRANEMAVLGRTPSFPAPVLAQWQRPSGRGR